MSLSISDAHVFSAALKKARKKKHLNRRSAQNCSAIPYPSRRIWSAAAVPQALKISTTSAGCWIYPQMTVSSMTAMTGSALHITSF
jgi:hypothetical protein